MKHNVSISGVIMSLEDSLTFDNKRINPSIDISIANIRVGV